MDMQRLICAEKSKEFVGKTMEVLIDGKIAGEDVYCGRTYRDAPDIDGLVFVKTKMNFFLENLFKLK